MPKPRYRFTVTLDLELWGSGASLTPKQARELAGDRYRQLVDTINGATYFSHSCRLVRRKLTGGQVVKPPTPIAVPKNTIVLGEVLDGKMPDLCQVEIKGVVEPQQGDEVTYSRRYTRRWRKGRIVDLRYYGGNDEVTYQIKPV